MPGIVRYPPPVAVDGSGFVGIGVASPTVRLDVSGSTTISSQNNVAAAFGATTSGRLLVGSITGNTPFIGSEGATNLLFTTNAIERMRIDSSGQVGIGAAGSTGYTLRVAKNITGAVTAGMIVANGEIQSDVTTTAHNFQSLPSIANAVFTLGSLNHFTAGQGTKGASATLTNQIGFFVASSLTGATNNYGFSGNIAAATGAWNLYMGGTAPNYLLGRLGVGATLTSGAMAQVVNTTAADKAFVVKGAASQTGLLFDVQNSAATTVLSVDPTGGIAIGATSSDATSAVRISKNISGATSSFNVFTNSIVQSDVTTAAFYFSARPITAAAAFTVTDIYNFQATATTIGAGSAVTNQYGFSAASLTTATNNYGFHGNTASGSNRWNLYMNGTAANYMAGRLGVGATLTSGAMTQVVNTTASDKALVVKGAASQTGNLQDWQDSAGTVLAHVTSAGAAKFVSIDGGTA